MGVGHNPANIILLSSNRFNDIHGRLHDKLDEQIGRYAEKLIDTNRKYIKHDLEPQPLDDEVKKAIIDSGPRSNIPRQFRDD